MSADPWRKQVRAEGRAARQAVIGDERMAAETSLIAKLASLHALNAPSVGVFIAHDGEPDLQPLIRSLWDRGAVVALPVLNPDPTDYSMRFVQWDQNGSLTSGRYGIPEPAPGPVVEPASLLVSLVGFDAIGNRIGRGAGFFDRYLAAYKGSAIGVGFEAQRFDQIPVQTHDVPLPTIVTDLGVRFLCEVQTKNAAIPTVLRSDR